VILKPDSPLVGALHPSPNAGERRKGCRASMVLLHYTGMSSAERAVHWLANPKSKVSCHYVIDDDGSITQMVPEGMRAWHAGASHWAGETDINSVSIGIEIQNPGHDHGYPDFPPPQMQSVAALCRDIAKRRGVRPERILAHSDVAPGRKIDPGEKFDWRWLAQNGVGHWVAPPPLAPKAADCGEDRAALSEAAELLARYGYDVERCAASLPRSPCPRRAEVAHRSSARPDGRASASPIEGDRLLHPCGLDQLGLLQRIDLAGQRGR
jgi:N-acetylmuramoyl-L-alanine amidase